MAMRDFEFNPDFEGAATVQESYDSASSHYTDLFGAKFDSFNPESIISGGTNNLKSGQFDFEIEDSDLALGYKQPQSATSPKPGRFFD